MKLHFNLPTMSAQVTEDRINAIEGRRRPQANPDQSTRDWLSASQAL
jgi:hypothetical protein